MKPNILVFLTDDHGRWVNGCYGNSCVHTPSIDYLACSGTRFENAYTPTPVCSPARASFWTGKIPSQHGVHDHIADPSHPGLTGQTNLGEMLQDTGYRTGFCGKWHGHAHGHSPQPGFDSWFSQWRGTNAVFNDQPFSSDGVRADYHGHQAPIISQAALRFLEAHRASGTDQPYFLFVGFTDTHSPHEANPERLVQPYRDSCLASVERETYADVHGYPVAPIPDDERERRELLAQNYAAAELIDEQVGRIIDNLESAGELDNTVIIYTADHGAMNGQHGLSAKGNATIPQNFLEESIRIPLVVRHPDTVGRGQVVTAPVDHCDLHATLRDIAGLPPIATTPGQSWLPFLARGDAQVDTVWRDQQICEYGNARMIRTAGGLKLITRYPGPNGHFADEFYDLNTDPRERENVISNPLYRAEIDGLRRDLAAFFSQFEIPSCAGTRVSDMSPFNQSEPWRKRPAGWTSPLSVRS